MKYVGSATAALRILIVGLAIGVASVTATVAGDQNRCPESPPEQLKLCGWFPDDEPLFGSLLADPRWPHFGASYRYYVNERDFRDVAAVSFGETFAFYRWPRKEWGQVEVGIQAAVFSIFEPFSPSSDLVNTDFFVAPLTVAYAKDAFQAFLRAFHQSSHLGDEFLLRNTRINRVNLSYEAADLKLSYDLHKDPLLRIYGGAGYLFDRDPASLKPWSTQVGTEFRWTNLDFPIKPVAAVDIQNREQNGYGTDLSVRAGFQLGPKRFGRKFMVLGEYFRGHSFDGQFYKSKIDYIGGGLHFYY